MAQAWRILSLHSRGMLAKALDGRAMAATLHVHYVRGLCCRIQISPGANGAPTRRRASSITPSSAGRPQEWAFATPGRWLRAVSWSRGLIPCIVCWSRGLIPRIVCAPDGLVPTRARRGLGPEQGFGPAQAVRGEAFAPRAAPFLCVAEACRHALSLWTSSYRCSILKRKGANRAGHGVDV